jgi:hypothetical protein
MLYFLKYALLKIAKENEIITFSALREQYCSHVPKLNNVFLKYYFPAIILSFIALMD